MEQLDIDNLLTTAANNERVSAPNDSWAAIHEALHQKDKKRRIAFWLLPLLITTFIGGYWLGNNRTQKTVCALPTVQHIAVHQQKNQLVKIEPNAIDKIDDVRINNEKAVSKAIENSVSTLPLVFGKNRNTISFDNKKIENETAPEKSIATNASNDELTNNTTSNTTIEIENNNSTATISSESVLTNNKQIDTTTTTENNTTTRVVITDKIIHDTKKVKLPTDTSATLQKLINNKKWNIEIAASSSFMTISSSNIFNTKAESSLSNTQNFGPSNAINIKPKLKALNASIQQVSIVANKNFKKTTFQVGAQIQYGSYNTIGYGSNANNITNVSGGILFNDLSAQTNFFGNNVLTAPLRQDNTPIYLKNHFLNVGLILGITKNIITYNKKPRVSAGIQLVPSYSILQNLYWLNETNSRIWSDKTFDRKVNLNNNLSLDYLCRFGKYNAKIGPVYNFSTQSLNKKNSNIANINVNAIGLKFGIQL